MRLDRLTHERNDKLWERVTRLVSLSGQCPVTWGALGDKAHIIGMLDDAIEMLEERQQTEIETLEKACKRIVHRVKFVP